MPNIEWTPDDAIDPYPAVLEALGKSFAWARQGEKHIGVLGGSEPAIVAAMYNACVAVLCDRDAVSVGLLNQ